MLDFRSKEDLSNDLSSGAGLLIGGAWTTLGEALLCLTPHAQRGPFIFNRNLFFSPLHEVLLRNPIYESNTNSVLVAEAHALHMDSSPCRDP